MSIYLSIWYHRQGVVTVCCLFQRSFSNFINSDMKRSKGYQIRDWRWFGSHQNFFVCCCVWSRRTQISIRMPSTETGSWRRAFLSSSSTGDSYIARRVPTHFYSTIERNCTTIRSNYPFSSIDANKYSPSKGIPESSNSVFVAVKILLRQQFLLTWLATSFVPPETALKWTSQDTQNARQSFFEEVSMTVNSSLLFSLPFLT